MLACDSPLTLNSFMTLEMPVQAMARMALHLRLGRTWLGSSILTPLAEP